MRTYYTLNQANALERLCRSCGHFWFEDIEDGSEPCGYCGHIRSVRDGKVDRVEIKAEAFDYTRFRLDRGL